VRKPHRRTRWPLALFAALLLGLALAASTNAATNLVGYFELGGEFEGSLELNQHSQPPRAAGAAVNGSGSGGASPGDVYVFGHGVRQLSASDQFIRIWGVDAVADGPGQADETQAVRVDATGGAFKLAFGAAATADIPANAGAAQVEAALDGLPSIGAGGVSVSGGPGDAGGTSPYLVSFDGASVDGVDQPQLKASDGASPLSGGGAQVEVYTTNQGGTGFEICGFVRR
jgi:hypothetical protein